MTSEADLALARRLYARACELRSPGFAIDPDRFGRAPDYEREVYLAFARLSASRTGTAEDLACEMQKGEAWMRGFNRTWEQEVDWRQEHFCELAKVGLERDQFCLGCAHIGVTSAASFLCASCTD